MTHFSDTQAVILSAAAQRPERIALPLPDSLRGGAAAKVIGAMLTKGLLQEVEANLHRGEPLWRETGDGHGTTLVATDGAAYKETMDVEPKSIVIEFVEPNGLIHSEMTLEIPDTPHTPDALQEMFERTMTENLWREKAGELLAAGEYDPAFRHKFHTYWTTAGHHIRAQIDDDSVLTSLLRLILPPYVGPSRTLYRGENLDRWTSRRIGLCWSENADTARMFGRGLNATGAGGVLLQCYALDGAIIAGPSDHSLCLGEGEYTLDLSKISEIEAIEQYPSPD